MTVPISSCVSSYTASAAVWLSSAEDSEPDLLWEAAAGWSVPQPVKHKMPQTASVKREKRFISKILSENTVWEPDNS